MDTYQSFADLLDRHMKAAHLGDARLANLVNDFADNKQFLHRSTVRNWRTGMSQSAQDWRQVAAIASVLKLDVGDADRLLTSSQCPTLALLQANAAEADQRFLDRWQKALNQTESAESDSIETIQRDQPQPSAEIELAVPPATRPSVVIDSPPAQRSPLIWLGLAALILAIGAFAILRGRGGSEANPVANGPELRAHWSFDASSDNTVVNVASDLPDGALQNDPMWEETPNGRTLEFDGTDDFVAVEHAPAFSQVPFSVAFWYRIDALPTERDGENAIIVRNKHTEGKWYANWDVGVLSTDNLLFSIYPPDEEMPIRLPANVRPIVGDWYHVVAVLDETYQIHLYVNGEKQTETREVEPLYAATGNLVFGAGGNNQRLKGAMRDVWLYDVALTSADVASHYEETR